MRLLAFAALALALAGATPAAAAALYKWTDANGRVVYSDQPPTGNVKTETLRAPAPIGNADAVKDLANRDVEFRKRQAEAAEGAKKSDAQRADAAKRNEQCTRVAGQIKMLSSDQLALVRQNEKGEVVQLDNAMRQKERTDLELWMKTNCSPA